MAQEYPSEIPPHSVIELPVNVVIAGRPGMFSKKVAVLLGTDPPSSILLRIQGRIGASGAFILFPSELNFGTVQSSEVVERTIQIRRYDDTPIRLVRVLSHCLAVSIGEIPPSNADSRCLQITCKFDGRLVDENPLRSSVVIETAVEGYKIVEIPVVAMIRGQPVGIVSHLQVLELKLGERREIVLSERSGANWSRIRDLQLEGDAPLRIQLPETAQNAALTATVSVEGDPLQGSLTRFFRVYVTGVVANDDDQEEHFRIPLVVSLAALE